MKKLVTAFTACMLAGLVTAATDGVYSQNVVGYHQIPLVAGFNMIGLNFQDVGGANSMSIQGATNKLIDVNEIASSDLLQIFDTTTQKFIVYSMYPNTGSSPAWDGQWTQVGVGTLIPLSLNVGQGFLFNSSSAKNLTFKGQADMVATTNVFNFTAGFNAFCCKFPAGFDFNSEVVGGVNAAADLLQLFDTTSQKFTVYSMYPNTGSSPVWDGKWTEVGVGTLLGALTMDLGEGGLYVRDAASTGTPITFSRPY